MKYVSENLWVLEYPLRHFGVDQGRRVTVIRLTSGEIALHSTAPFTPDDVEAVRKEGHPAWLLEAMLLHDTYTKEGMTAFGGTPLLAPEGFAESSGIPAQPLTPAPEAWKGELEVLALAGMPKIREHVFYHTASRTLIVADLIFNMRPKGPWARFVWHWLAGLQDRPGMTRIFRLMVKDRAAFKESVQKMLQWEFDRIIPGHGEVIETGGKAELEQALKAAGF